MITKHSTRGLWNQFGRFLNLVGGNFFILLTCISKSAGLSAVAKIMSFTCCFHRWTFKQLYDKGMVYRGFKVNALNMRPCFVRLCL